MTFSEVTVLVGETLLNSGFGWRNIKCCIYICRFDNQEPNRKLV